ncbi:MAG: ribonuclease Z [Ruminococcaceae bacterium]|nr:ribonuclease Z [Oscillospiraceae bacterium]
MKIAVCVCNNMGMLFNSRRQSRDRVLIRDFVDTAKNNRILINHFSKNLFDEYEVTIDDDMMNIAEKNDYCFIENTDILPYINKINEITIYRWNRKYPADFYFQMPSGFTLKETYEFKGSSHEKITKEVYVK